MLCLTFEILKHFFLNSFFIKKPSFGNSFEYKYPYFKGKYSGCRLFAVADLYNLIQIPISVAEPLPELEQFGRSQLEGKAPALAPALAQAEMKKKIF